MNEVNAMISFGNVVLYNYLATNIYRSPLDIRTGFLHATNNRKESLNLDLAEIFKPLIVDRVVFSLINLRSINLTHFYTTDNGEVYLNENGKRIFLRAFYEKLNTVVTVKDTRQSYRRIIKNEIYQLSLHFKNGEKYTGFRQVR
jgi:CRISPR-associated protein Cas1